MVLSTDVFTFDSQSSVYWGTFFSCSVSRVHIERMESKVKSDSALLDLYTTREKSATAKKEIYITQLRFERLSRVLLQKQMYKAWEVWFSKN